MVAAEEQAVRGTVRERRDQGLAWAAGAWAVAALEVGAEARAVPERARACGNPAEAVAVRAAGDWEPVVSGRALAEAAPERAAGQEAAEEQVLAQEELVAVPVGERELAVA